MFHPTPTIDLSKCLFYVFVKVSFSLVHPPEESDEANENDDTEYYYWYDRRGWLRVLVGFRVLA